MAAPGLHVIARLASVLSVPVADLLPASAQPDTEAALREQSRRLFDDVMKQADREVLKVLSGLLFRLNEAKSRGPVNSRRLTSVLSQRPFLWLIASELAFRLPVTSPKIPSTSR